MVFRRVFVALNAYITKEEKSKISSKMFHFKKLEKEVSRRKQLSVEVKKSVKLRTANHQRKISEIITHFFENINKIDKLLARLTKKKRRMHITNIKKRKSGILLMP